MDIIKKLYLFLQRNVIVPILNRNMYKYDGLTTDNKDSESIPRKEIYFSALFLYRKQLLLHKMSGETKTLFPLEHGVPFLLAKERSSKNT